MKYLERAKLGLGTRLLAGVIGLSAASIVAAAPVAVATYDFDDGTLNADEAGVSALTAIDPLGQNAFITDNVLGTTKTVYRFDGNKGPVNEQAGLSMNTAGLIAGNAYSVDIVFSFDANDATWERILDASNRSSDNGFYVEPGNKLQIYPVGNGPNLWTFGQYHRVTLTNDGSGHVTAYLDGAFQFDLTTSVMDFTTYGASNPDHLLVFFADNLVGGGQQEFVDGKVSLIRLYNLELSNVDVGNIGNGDTGNGNGIGTVPEPTTLALLGIGLAAGLRRRRS